MLEIAKLGGKGLMHLGQRFLKILPLVMVITLIPLLAEWGAQRREVLLPSVVVDDLPEADLRIKGGRFVEMEANRLVWRLDVDVAQLFEKDNYAQLERVNALFSQEDGRKVRLEGQEGKLELDTKNLALRGKVKAVSSDGIKLETETLHWEDSQQKLTSPDWVSIERDKMRVTGKGMEADTRLSKLVIKEQVTSYLNLKNRE